MLKIFLIACLSLGMVWFFSLVVSLHNKRIAFIDRCEEVASIKGHATREKCQKEWVKDFHRTKRVEDVQR